MAMEMPFQATYSPLKNCSPLWDSSDFVVFLMTLRFAPPLSSSIVSSLPHETFPPLPLFAWQNPTDFFASFVVAGTVFL